MTLPRVSWSVSPRKGDRPLSLQGEGRRRRNVTSLCVVNISVIMIAYLATEMAATMDLCNESKMSASEDAVTKRVSYVLELLGTPVACRLFR